MRLVAMLLLIAGLVAGCGSTAGEDEAGWFVRYERVWPDGLTERETIWPDGRLLMHHGEHLERLTIEAEDVARIQAALEEDIPRASEDDSPRRTVTLPSGEEIVTRPDRGSAIELLERLLDRHTLDPPDGSPAPDR